MTLQVDSELIDLRTRIRHSAAHVMADVVKTLFPDAKIGIGPPTDDGFYYDFMVENPFTPEDIRRIENRMRRVIKRNHKFEYAEYSRDEINELNADEPLKLESHLRDTRRRADLHLHTRRIRGPVRRAARRINRQDTRIQVAQRRRGLLAW